MLGEFEFHILLKLNRSSEIKFAICPMCITPPHAGRFVPQPDRPQQRNLSPRTFDDLSCRTQVPTTQERRSKEIMAKTQHVFGSRWNNVNPDRANGSSNHYRQQVDHFFRWIRPWTTTIARFCTCALCGIRTCCQTVPIESKAISFYFINRDRNKQSRVQTFIGRHRLRVHMRAIKCAFFSVKESTCTNHLQ